MPDIASERPVQARPGSLEVLHDASITWRYIAPHGVTVEDVQRPDFFGNLTRECGQPRVVGRHAWNKIEILAEDGSWEAWLRVLSVEPNRVFTRLIWQWSQPAKPGRKPSTPDGYTVEHVASGWRAIDAKSFVISDKHATEEDAIRAAAAHARKAA